MPQRKNESGRAGGDGGGIARRWAGAGLARRDDISRVITKAFSAPGAPAVPARSNYPFRLHLRLDPREMPFKFEGKFEARQEVFADLSRFDECVPGLYAGTVVEVARELGLYEVALTTGFVVMVMEEVLRDKPVENWRKNGISSQLAEGVPVFTSMSGAETYFSAIVEHKVARDQFEFPTSEMWTVKVLCDDDVVDSPLRWLLCRGPVDERFSLDNQPSSGNGGDLYVGSPVYARPSRLALDEFITTTDVAGGASGDSAGSSPSAQSYYGRWLAGTVVGIGCHPNLKRPWDQGRFLVKFSFEPMLCYVAERNIIKRSSEDVAEGEWIPHALGDIVFADDLQGDLAHAARIVAIDAERGFRMTLYFPHSGRTQGGFLPYMVQQPKLRVPKFCIAAPRAYSQEQAGRHSCSLTSVYNLERLLLRCLLEEENWVYVPQEPVSCNKRSKHSGMDSVWRPMGGVKVQYTSNADYSDTVSHLEHTECISDKGTVWKLMQPFHVTPPTWLYEEDVVIPPPHTHLDPGFFVEGSAARAVLEPAWNAPAARATRQRRRQGEAAAAPAPAADDNDDDAPVLTPKVAAVTAALDPLQAAAAALTAEQLREGLRKDTVWFCKPAGRDYGGGMILGNSLEDCLANPNFDKEDTYVLQPHILRPQLNDDGTKFGVRLYLLIVNDDDERGQLRAYTHTTAGYVAVGVDRKWDPLDTDKKLQLTHTGRKFENELDNWAHYDVLFPKMARQLAVLFREAKHHLECDTSKRCFELFGCDFVVDKDMEPWFLEVNTGPLLNESQYSMLCDTARIVFYNQPANANLWQRLDTLYDGDDAGGGAAARAAVLKAELAALKQRQDKKFDEMLARVGPESGNESDDGHHHSGGGGRASGGGAKE